MFDEGERKLSPEIERSKSGKSEKKILQNHTSKFGAISDNETAI